MPAFEYTALNTKGREEKGVLEGENARAVRQALREKGLTPTAVNETNKTESQSSGSGLSFKIGGKVGNKDLSLFTRQLATLVRSGTPLEEGLSTVSKQTTKNSVKSVLLNVRSKVLEGHSLASALKEHPRVFPVLYQATVAAGEQAGHLDLVLERLAEYTEARQEMNQKVGMALLYPVILSLLAITIVVGLMVFIVPQIVGVFEDMQSELPALTQILIGTSDFIKAYGLYLLAVIIAGYIIFKRMLRNPQFQFRYDTFLLGLPVIGELVRGINTARFARTLSILAASGVPILEALGIASEVVRNMPMKQAIDNATIRVREGTSISRSLEQSGLFPPITMHLIASGESSGKLEEMLERAAQHQEKDTSNAVAVFVGLFEPMMILFMAVMVLVIVLAILLPIFNMNQLVS